jgi:hypothetical protein
MSSSCETTLDRCICVASSNEASPPNIPGLRVVRDSFISPQTNVPTYRRVRVLVCPISSARISLEYQPLLPWLKAFRITIIADDRHELSYQLIGRVIGAFRHHRLRLLEIANDFDAGSHVDANYVSQHGTFGKCRRCLSRLFAKTLRYGTRRSAKLVRCYWKPNLHCFRVELELHSAWLSKHNIFTIEDVRHLPTLIFPRHMRFVRLNLVALRRHLETQGTSIAHLKKLALVESRSLHEALRFLRYQLGIRNPHRFLVPLPLNRKVLCSLETWAQKFRKSTSRSPR